MINIKDEDEDGFTSCDGDCNDNNPNVYPGAAPKDSLTDCLLDADGDGYGSAVGGEGALLGTDCDDNDPVATPEDYDGDGFSSCENDCDDQDQYTFPGAAEKESTNLCMTDVDLDGYGDSNPSENVDAGTDCDDNDGFLEKADEDGDGFSTCDGDCDDSDPFTFIGAAERDSIDLCMTDADDDGYGSVSPAEGALAGNDCDDYDVMTYAGAAELDSEAVCMRDADGDGWGDPEAPNNGEAGSDCDDTNELYLGQENDTDCDGTDFSVDCDDNNDQKSPLLDEICDDEMDNNCDGVIDEDECTSTGPWTFTTCLQSGDTNFQVGPSQDDCYLEYYDTKLQGNVTIEDHYQVWTVPVTGTYKIEVFGARGGNSKGSRDGDPRCGYLEQQDSSRANYGGGAILSGNFELTVGVELQILVGQRGADSTYSSGDQCDTNWRYRGGGGGTFVVSNDELLIVAGGGAGSGYENGNSKDGHVSEYGGTGGMNGTGGVGGTDGYKGVSQSTADAGLGFEDGAIGNGQDGSAKGGFGGGGSTDIEGGGGYSGGGAGNENYSGGGGGSYNSGENQDNQMGGNDGHGKVVIEFIE